MAASGDRGVARSRGPAPDRRGGERGAGVEPAASRTAPSLPESVSARDLDGNARGRLRTLSKENADAVARHLVMAGRLLDEDPEAAYAHAQEAVRRAGRVDVVREAAGITAYRVGRYAEALRELRTARRLNGSEEHLALMADCERGLGRPERALALAHTQVEGLSMDVRVELAIVAAGARMDLGDAEAALAELGSPEVLRAGPPQSWRLAEARAEALLRAGRPDEAQRLLDSLPAGASEDEEIEVFDLEDASDESSPTGGAREGALP